MFHARAEPADDGFYAVDHSAFVYLMGPDGGYLTHFAHDVGAERMAREIRRHLAVGM